MIKKKKKNLGEKGLENWNSSINWEDFRLNSLFFRTYFTPKIYNEKSANEVSRVSEKLMKWPPLRI